jgi:hypothetical protein
VQLLRHAQRHVASGTFVIDDAHVDVGMVRQGDGQRRRARAGRDYKLAHAARNAKLNGKLNEWENAVRHCGGLLF